MNMTFIFQISREETYHCVSGAFSKNDFVKFLKVFDVWVHESCFRVLDPILKFVDNFNKDKLLGNQDFLSLINTYHQRQTR